MNYWLIFLTGLTTGGISCAAVQGGLLATLIANQPNQKIGPKLIGFLGAKLFAYTLVGIILGLVGSAFQINQTVILIFQTIAALYLIASALNLLEVHPVFRYVSIQPPKQLFKQVKHAAKLDQWFAPILLGALTILIPCGVTQAMEITAVSTGNPVSGGLILFFFILGTMPLFAVIGLAMQTLSNGWRKVLYQVSAALLIILGLSSLNGVLIALDSPVSTRGIMATYQKLKRYESNMTLVTGETQPVTITIDSRGYTPDFVQVKKGVPVVLTLKTGDSYSCANYFVFRAFNISARMKSNETQTFTFTPNKVGQFTFSCSMGMYSGTMEVVN